jgi:hypothetical protein
VSSLNLGSTTINLRSREVLNMHIDEYNLISVGVVAGLEAGTEVPIATKPMFFISVFIGEVSME